MGKVGKLFALIKKGEFRVILHKVWETFQKNIYVLYAKAEDLRMGGMSIDKRIPSQYNHLGANATLSTDYRLLKRVFKSYPIKEDDIFVDVGCGQGRVLTYLYLRGIRNKMFGVEIDPEVAETAKVRTRKCDNIEILCANILDCTELIKGATAIYIFNPFNETVLLPFIKLIEEQCHHNVTLYYLNDIHRQHLDKRAKWRILRRDIVKRPDDISFPYSIYKYFPDS